MGYACPVCETPQADAGHLANHLAFTAIARGGDHEAWLDDRVPEWSSLDEDALAERVVDHAEAADFPQVFEDTTGQHADHDHSSGDPVSETGESIDAPVDPSGLAAGDLSEAELQSVVEEATELTRKRREDSETE